MIEIENLAQLNTIRWDLNGDGQADKGNFAIFYQQDFPGVIENMDIPADVQVQGYELSGVLVFGNNPDSWDLIGVFTEPYQLCWKGTAIPSTTCFKTRAMLRGLPINRVGYSGR